MSPPMTPHTLITSCSVEAIFLGMNWALYAFCTYTLWGHKSVSCRLLLFINTVQFLLCVAHFALHMVFSFLLFTVVTNVPTYLHHVNGFTLASNVIYNISFLITGFISVLRLYVLYDNDVRVCIPAFLLWIAQICASGLTIRICAKSLVPSQSFIPNVLVWIFISAVNVCVTIPICFWFCILQKNTHTILSSAPYKSVVIIFVECGALVTFYTIAMTILQACKSAYVVVSFGIVTEIALASQLLVIAQHALLNQKDDTPTHYLTSLRGAGESQSESRHVDVPMTPTTTQSRHTSSSEPSPEGSKDGQGLSNV